MLLDRICFILDWADFRARRQRLRPASPQPAPAAQSRPQQPLRREQGGSAGSAKTARGILQRGLWGSRAEKHISSFNACLALPQFLAFPPAGVRGLAGFPSPRRPLLRLGRARLCCPAGGAPRPGSPARPQKCPAQRQHPARPEDSPGPAVSGEGPDRRLPTGQQKANAKGRHLGPSPGDTKLNIMPTK